MAEQEFPIRRKVALKVIKAGLDTKQVIARFEAERQALAIMDHENIARVLDAGATDIGRPYFVMELVHGVPITEYCDQHQLSPCQRLELFIQVCRAVQHAHTKGIIHRDIKPTNVLVTSHDDLPVPKVIDFGVAKATGQQPLTDRTLFTHVARMVGTPLYMSPEQAEMSGLDVDTRSDVYSLGVLLYELLTGTTPFGKDRLKAAAVDEVRRIIREEDPPKPSTRISTMGENLTVICSARDTEPKKLGQIVRGELDWIVMKALEKDRTRRYETANGLARDVERYLSDQPVEACPPSRLYRFGKFARRNKATIATTAVLAVVLVLAAAVSTSQAIRARGATLDALRERSNALREAKKQDAVNAFLQDMLASVNPDSLAATDRVNGGGVTVREMLDEAVRRLDAGSLKEHREIEPEVRRTIGNAYNGIGEPAAAESTVRKALEVSRQIHGSEHQVVANCMVDLAQVIQQTKWAEGELLAREALAMQHRLFGGEHPDMALPLNFLGCALKNRRHLREAEALFQESLAIHRKFFGEESQFLPRGYRDLAETLMYGGKLDEAEPLLRKALELDRKLLGEEHPDTTWTKLTLAELLTAQSKRVEAMAILREVVATERRRGTSGIRLADGLSYLGILLETEGSLSEAEELHREALVIWRKLFGEEGGKVVWSLESYSRVLRAEGKTAEAETLWRETLEYWRKKLETADSAGQRSQIHLRLFRHLINTGQVEEAKASCREVLKLNPTEATVWELNRTAWSLATSAIPAERDPGLAVELAEKVTELSPRAWWLTLGVARYRAGDLKQAVADLERDCELRNGGDSFNFLFLAMAHWRLGDLAVARQCYEKGVQMMPMGQRAPENQELARFRAEAEQVLGLAARPASQPAR
jgi:tetratricopeptide (TPR) repeat protein